MKQLMVLGVVLLSWVSGEVMAGCSNATQVKNGGGALANRLNGKTINADAPGGENWKEQHTGGPGGTLNKVGLGCTDPVDPTTPVGTWNVSGAGVDSRVDYNYGTDGTYSWSVHDNGGGSSYTFCTAPGGTEIATGTLSANVLCSP